MMICLVSLNALDGNLSISFQVNHEHQQAAGDLFWKNLELGLSNPDDLR